MKQTKSYLEKHLLKNDAVNRLVRALYIAIGVGLIVDVWPMMIAAIDTGSYHWREMGKAALRVSLQGVGAYVLRRFGDGSSVPTPVPPSDPGEPSDPVEGV